MKPEIPGQDCNVLLHSVVAASTWGAVAGCLYRERSIEKESKFYFHIIHISENI
jgi:hypothetical protein